MDGRNTPIGKERKRCTMERGRRVRGMGRRIGVEEVDEGEGDEDEDMDENEG